MRRTHSDARAGSWKLLRLLSLLRGYQLGVGESHVGGGAALLVREGKALLERCPCTLKSWRFALVRHLLIALSDVEPLERRAQHLLLGRVLWLGHAAGVVLHGAGISGTGAGVGHAAGSPPLGGLSASVAQQPCHPDFSAALRGLRKSKKNS